MSEEASEKKKEKLKYLAELAAKSTAKQMVGKGTPKTANTDRYFIHHIDVWYNILYITQCHIVVRCCIVVR